jgi:lysophospholipase L1-like esterase
MQAWRAAHAGLPTFGDHDPSGHYGSFDGTAVRIATLGDSTLTGAGLDHPQEIWITRVVERIAARVPLRLESHAVGGARIHDVLVRQVDRVACDPPHVAVVSVGANDAIHGSSARRAQRELTDVLATISTFVPQVLLFGVGDLSVIPRAPRSLRPVLSARSRLFDRVHMRAVDAVDGVMRVPAGPLTNRVFRERGDVLFAADRFHPNAAGHEVWADAFEPFIAAAVARVARMHESVARRA